MSVKHLKVSLTAALILVGIVALAAPAARSAHTQPAILYVAPGGNCGGASPCYSTVQDAVDAAYPGDEIRVAEGMYTDVNLKAGLPQVLFIHKSVTIRGGYTITNWTNPDPDTNHTVLNAQMLGRVVYITDPQTTVRLEGLHLIHGNPDGFGGHEPYPWECHDAGSGVYIFESNVTIDHCWIERNVSLPGYGHSNEGGYGGGVYVQDGVLHITKTILEENEASWGVAMYLYHAEAHIGPNVTIRDNRTTAVNGKGAAIAVEGGVFTLTESTIKGNRASAVPPAGALDLYLALFLIEDSRISETSVSHGVNVLASNGTLRHNIIQANDCIGVSIDGDSLVVLEGNEIRYNQGNGEFSGGGVRIQESSATLVGNHIYDNRDNLDPCEGAGVYIRTDEEDAVTLTDNVISGNIAGNRFFSFGVGGGVYIDGDNVLLDSNVIQDNTAIGHDWPGGPYGGHGGGVYICGNPTLINNVITDNQAQSAGSGIYVVGSSPNLYHNTIAQNIHGEGDGTGVYVVEGAAFESCHPKLYNTIIASQTIGIYATARNTVFADGILWHGNVTDTHGTGTFFLSHEHTGDPRFRYGDYHIGPGSAAINAGIDAGVTTDVDGQTRPHYGAYDLGADEWWPLAAVKITTPDTARPDDVVTYTVTLRNMTDDVSMTVCITDVLPTGVEYIGPLTYTGGSGSYAEGVVTWTGDVPPHEPILIAWPVGIDASPGAVITNTATVDDAHGLFQTEVATVRVLPPRYYVYLPLMLSQAEALVVHDHQ